MVRLIVWRLVQLPFILAAIFFITFTLAWLLPGDPLLKEGGKLVSPEIHQAMQKQYNLDSPWSFMRSYLRGLLLEGDLGPSLQNKGLRVNEILATGMSVSARLGLLALIIALAIGITAGLLGAARPRSFLDGASYAMALVGVSLPSFVTGFVLMIVFAGLLKWFPVGGWNEGRIQNMILPAITLSLAPAAYISRLVRLGLADVMSSDYIRTARAKGLPEHKVLMKHALKVAFLPVLSFLGPAAAITMTGSFVVESVFGIHQGLGEYFVNAVLNKDQSLILGLVLVYSTMLVVFNLLVDVAYAWIDPRIELE